MIRKQFVGWNYIKNTRIDRKLCKQYYASNFEHIIHCAINIYILWCTECLIVWIENREFNTFCGIQCIEQNVCNTMDNISSILFTLLMCMK